MAQVKKPIYVMIDKELHDKMRHFCIKKNTTITQVVTNAFEQILDEEERWKEGEEDGNEDGKSDLD